MPGIITSGDRSPSHFGKNPSYRYDVTIEFDASGNISGVPLFVHPGYVMAIDTIPDANDPPVDGYAIQILNEYGVDILAGGGLARSAVASQRLQGKPSPVSGNLYPTISGGGPGAKVRIMLYLQGA